MDLYNVVVYFEDGRFSRIYNVIEDRWGDQYVYKGKDGTIHIYPARNVKEITQTPVKG